MSKKDKESEDHLIKLYCTNVIFRRYYQYNLWFGDFDEYDIIIYCTSYFQGYIYCWINIFLLERFSPFFVAFLYKNPSFLNFVESGFLKYLDYHFLFSFSNNRSIFDLKDKLLLDIFIKSYFHIFFKNRFEKDLLILINKVINDTFLNVITKGLINRLNYFKINMGRVKLDKARILKILKIQKKKLILFLNVFDYNYLIKNYKFFFQKDLNFVYKSLNSFEKTINFKENKILNLVKASKSIKKKNFIELLLKSKELDFNNKDIQYLIEIAETLEKYKKKKIGLYINSNILFEDSFEKTIVQNSLILNKSNIKSQFKSQSNTFNNYFVKYCYKRKF